MTSATVSSQMDDEEHWRPSLSEIWTAEASILPQAPSSLRNLTTLISETRRLLPRTSSTLASFWRAHEASASGQEHAPAIAAAHDSFRPDAAIERAIATATKRSQQRSSLVGSAGLPDSPSLRARPDLGGGQTTAPHHPGASYRSDSCTLLFQCWLQPPSVTPEAGLTRNARLLGVAIGWRDDGSAPRRDAWCRRGSVRESHAPGS